jgi:lipoprotein-anchoring transpeptidase ErfK/SrfK
LRIRISIAVIAAAFAGSVGGAAAQYYPPPPYGYPAYPAPAYSQAPLPPPNYGPPPADPSYQPQAPYGGGPYQRYAPPPDRMSSAGDELPPQPMPPGLAGEPFQRPPAGIVADPNDTTGALPPAAPVARPNSAAAVAALPPEDQPEQGPPKQLPPQFRRQMVDYVTSEPPGTIVVDTPNTYLYMVLGNGKAMRYGIGVGREGFTWTGTERITRMKEWPDWFPPKEMIDRQPYLPRFMAGGETNPLGARALYLGNTLYRIHGTNQPSTIGTFVSSGCIRLTNDDIADLYSRVNVGTRVVVMPGAYPVSAAAQHSVAQ